MNKLKAQADFVEALFLNLILSVKEELQRHLLEQELHEPQLR